MSDSEISLLFDEHIPSSTAQELRNRGIEVEAVYETELQSASDEEIVEYVIETGKVIVTQDSDFLELEEKGLIFLTEPLEIGELTRELLQVVQRLEREEVQNSSIFIPW
jgi:predicted nuclease of predicted toxin-antitoxin system